MNDKSADFEAEADNAASERSSEANFVDIFSAEMGRLKRIIAGMGLGASDAEDVLQDVVIQALRRTGKCQTKEDGIRWLIKVTVNRCLMEHRRRRSFCRRAPEILKRRSETATNPTTAEKKAVIDEEIEIVRECLQALDESLLTPMVLRYFCDLNSKEIGDMLGLNPSTVRSRLREVRMILAGRLIKRGVEP
ncbi:MAG: sigma-70 family RNA polymerase sigma factor [Sedimentisphaerales bacterium]